MNRIFLFFALVCAAFVVATDLERYHESCRSQVNEGFMTDPQKQQFNQQLQLYPNITSILEIGLNAGHSADNFFNNCPNLRKFVSFDIAMHDYALVSADYFSRTFSDRFTFVRGDSRVTVPAYANTYPGSTFDLIYIDGDHSYKGCLVDIIHCKSLAHENSIVWIDDFEGSVERAERKCVKSKLIKIEKVFHSSDDRHGARHWVQCRYL